MADDIKTKRITEYEEATSFGDNDFIFVDNADLGTRKVKSSTIKTSLATDAQINAIQTKGEETLASIPNNYTELSKDVDFLKTDIESFNESLFSSTLNIPLKWEPGWINSSGQLSDDDDRFRTTEFYKVHSGLNVKLESREYVGYVLYYDETKTFAAYENLSYVNHFVNPSYAYFKLDISRSSGGMVITETSAVSVSVVPTILDYADANQLQLKNIGYYSTEYSVSQGNSHSGLNDIIKVSLNVGDKIAIYGGSKDLQSDSNVCYAIFKNGTYSHIGTFSYATQPLEYTVVLTDIEGIGISNNNVSVSTIFHFDMFVEGGYAQKIDNLIGKLDPNEYPYTKEFTLGTSVHSARIDTIPLSAKSGESFYVLVETENGERLNSPVYGLKTDNSYDLIGTGYSGDIRKVTLSADIKGFGVYMGALSSGTTVVKVTAFKPDTLCEKIYSDSRSNKPFYNRNINDVNIDNKVSTFSDLFANGSASVESFLFFTDPHIFANGEYYAESQMQKAMNTIEYAYNRAPVSNVICGGDWLTSDDTVSEAVNKLAYINGICKTKFADHYYTMIGNHDTNYQGESTLANETIANLMLRNFGKNYYIFHGDRTKFFVFDTGIDSNPMTEYRWEQVAWFANKLLENTDNILALAMHIFTNQINKADFDSSPEAFTFADNITKVAQAFNAKSSVTMNESTYDFASATGKISFCICGHTHYDANTVWNTIPIIITRNSEYTPNIDLCYIDYANNKASLIRIGNGSDREITIL